jgi:hypothetical protein
VVSVPEVTLQHLRGKPPNRANGQAEGWNRETCEIGKAVRALWVLQAETDSCSIACAAFQPCMHAFSSDAHHERIASFRRAPSHERTQFGMKRLTPELPIRKYCISVSSCVRDKCLSWKCRVNAGASAMTSVVEIMYLRACVSVQAHIKCKRLQM